MLYKLKYHSTDSGNCRVYYRDENDKKALFCMQQDNSENRAKMYNLPLFVFYRCSKDGEPSHSIKLNTIRSIELAKDDNTIDKTLNKWLEDNKL